MAFELVLNLGNDTDVYNRMVASLPAGHDNLQEGMIVPAHSPVTPISFTITNVTPNVPHILHVASEFQVPPMPTIGFVPTSTSYNLSIPLAYGSNVILIVDNLGNSSQFFISSTNYATLFRAYAREISEHSNIPIQNLNNNISSPIGYILASPLIADINRYIPTSLESLGILANKLFVKNLLFRPGTDGSTRELLAAFSASNPVFNPMKNLGTPETPLFRSEEDFAGFEAHVWLPNREVERWRAFVTLINNLPQLYSLLQVNEGEVYLRGGGSKIKRHVFDFESDFANSVLDNGGTTDCFLRLFRIDLGIDAEHFIKFCRAAYFFDNEIVNPLLTPDTDLLGITNFTTWDLAGRFEQQWDIDRQHTWVYDSPLSGTLDGINRYFKLSQEPATSRAVKLFIDGLLLRLNIDYRISVGTDFRSGVFRLPNSADPIDIDVAVGDPRPFLGPVFTAVQIEGGDDTEFLVTATDQTSLDFHFVVSTPPETVGSPDEAWLHYVSPTLASGSYSGANEYGTVALPIGISTFVLNYVAPAPNIVYQLFVQYSESPGTAATTNQLHSIVRNHTLNSALVEFSAPIESPNAFLHYWIIEADGVAEERGTVDLAAGGTSFVVPFVHGPYVDQVALTLQLWNINAIGTVELPLYSFTNLNALSFTVQFSSPIPAGSGYMLDFGVWQSQAGNSIEIFSPPQALQLLEAHYDTQWAFWQNTGPIETVDGIRNVFTLPEECPVPAALYAVMDGRLMTQGEVFQYSLETATQVRVNFIPQNGQHIWFVYPLTNPLSGEEPSHAFYQGLLSRIPDFAGSFAVGDVFNNSVIDNNDTVSIKGEKLTARRTARGVVINSFKILVSDTLEFVELGVTLFAAQYVSNPTLGAAESANIICSADVGGSLASKWFFLNTPTTIYYVWFKVNGVGIDPLVPSRTGLEVDLDTNDTATTVAVKLSTVLGAQSTLLSTAQVATVSVTNQDIGTVQHISDGLSPTTFAFSTLIAGVNPTYTVDQFPVGVSQIADALSLLNKINTHPTLSPLYYAVYLGNGIVEIRARDLGAGAYNQTLVKSGTSLTASNIVGDLPKFLNEIQTITFSSVPTSGYFALQFGEGETSNIPYSASAAAVESAIHAALPGLTDVSVTGSFTAGFTVTFLEASGARPEPLLVVAGPEVSFAPADMTVVNSHINAPAHGFIELELVSFFTTGTTPTGITAGTLYYIHVIDSDTFELLDTGIGTPTVAFTDQGTGTHRVSRNSLSISGTQTSVTVAEVQQGYGGYFPSEVSQELDSTALAAALNGDSYLSHHFFASAIAGKVTVTARDIGEIDNGPITLTGTSLSTNNLSNGTDPKVDQPFKAGEPAYYRDAPVVALDGVSTRLYDLYTGYDVKFNTKPVIKQEPYIITQSFPIDYHPLDSLVPNQPCSYPKGLFTQGLIAKLTDFEQPVDEVYKLIMATDNLPVQEAPSGAIDGVNTVYDISLNSCAGQNSLMLFIDGIFQDDTRYAYSTYMGHGRITLSAPLIFPQKIWAWYLPTGDSCPAEHVEQVVGTLDPQTFTIPNSPFVDPQGLVLFCDGLFQLQNADYVINVGNTSLTYQGAIVPLVTQNIWCHFNVGNIGVLDLWRQIEVAVADGILSTFTIPHLLTSELPTSQDSVLLSLDGEMQRENVDFTVDIGLDGFPTGALSFTGGAPESGRHIQVAYIRRS